MGWGLWTFAMAHPAGPRLGYATPLLSTLILLATGQRLSTIALVGCALIVLCAIGVTMETLRPTRQAPHPSPPADTHSSQDAPPATNRSGLAAGAVACDRGCGSGSP